MVPIERPDLKGLLPEDAGPSLSRARLRSGIVARFAAAALRADAFVLGRNVFLSRRASQWVSSRSAEGLRLLVHELVHVDQFQRLGAWPFLRRYLREYLVARARGRTHLEAYAAIEFERQARERVAAVTAAESPSGHRRDA